MTLTISTISSRDEWNNALAKLPYAHILQSWEWGEFKYETTGWKPHRWAFKRGDKIVAMCSMGERKFGFLSLMYAPKGPAMDYADSALVDEVLSLLEAEAKKHRAIWLKIDPDIAYATGVPNEEDDAPAPIGAALKAKLEKNGWCLSDEQVQFRNTVTLDLTQSEDELLAAMSQNTRRKVRTAEKKDVTIRAASLADLDLLYDLYSSTGERNEFLIRPRDYYLKLWRYFMESDLAYALIAEFEGKAIAHVILFHFGQTCWYFYGASANEERERMPTYALQWEAIKWAKQKGYVFYDMWGAPNEFTEDDPMWGVFMFKRGFRGTVERRLGAWDYAPNAFLYQSFTQGWPPPTGIFKEEIRMSDVPAALNRFQKWLSSSLMLELVDAQVSFFTKERWAKTLQTSHNFKDALEFLIADNPHEDDNNKGRLSRLKVSAYAHKAYTSQSLEDRKTFFLSTMIWGYGDRPRGNNMSEMLKSDKLDNTVNSAMNSITEGNIVTAFDYFTNEASKIPYLNSSFFTKLIYFAGLASKNPTLPLILDRRVVNNWKTLTGVQLDQYKVDDYLSYIETVNEWASYLHCRADAIEYWLFISPSEFLGR